MSTNLHNLKNKNKSKQFLTDMPTHQPNLNNSSIEAFPLRCCAKLTRLTKYIVIGFIKTFSFMYVMYLDIFTSDSPFSVIAILSCR